MAGGTPVSTSNRSSLPEVIGDAALLADPDDRGQLPATLAGVAGKAALRDDFRERAQRCSWDETARRTVELYERVGRPMSTCRRGSRSAWHAMVARDEALSSRSGGPIVRDGGIG